MQSWKSTSHTETTNKKNFKRGNTEEHLHLPYLLWSWQTGTWGLESMKRRQRKEGQGRGGGVPKSRVKQGYFICRNVFLNTINWLLTAINKMIAAKSLQSCLTLCDPIDGSPPGSPVPGILKARTLEWVAISFSEFYKIIKKISWKVLVKTFYPTHSN